MNLGDWWNWYTSCHGMSTPDCHSTYSLTSEPGNIRSNYWKNWRWRKYPDKSASDDPIVQISSYSLDNYIVGRLNHVLVSFPNTFSCENEDGVGHCLLQGYLHTGLDNEIFLLNSKCSSCMLLKLHITPNFCRCHLQLEFFPCLCQYKSAVLW